MSNHTGKLIMNMWLKAKWWLKNGDFGNEEHTRLPISELPATPASDMVTKSHVDAQQTSMNVAAVEIDVEQVKEATKVLRMFTNECKKAEMALVSLTKSQFEAKRANNKKNLKKNAENTRNRQDVASESPISEPDYDLALTTCQSCGFVAHNWPSDALTPHITPNCYHKDLLCVGTWLQDPSLAPSDALSGEKALEFVKKKLDEAGIPEKEAGECPKCHWKPAEDGGPCRNCLEQAKMTENGPKMPPEVPELPKKTEK